MKEENLLKQVLRISIMYWQVEIDELAKEIEKEQLQRWEDSQEKVESCKSVADIVPPK